MVTIKINPIQYVIVQTHHRMVTIKINPILLRLGGCKEEDGNIHYAPFFSFSQFDQKSKMGKRKKKKKMVKFYFLPFNRSFLVKI